MIISSFQQYIVLKNHGQVIPIQGDVPMDVAALCACSGLTGYNAANAVRESVEAAIKSRGMVVYVMISFQTCIIVVQFISKICLEI